MQHTTPPTRDGGDNGDTEPGGPGGPQRPDRGNHSRGRFPGPVATGGPGRGCPAPVTDGGTTAAAEGTGDGGPATTVLIVDDEENVARAYELWLDGYETLTATGGEEALSVVDETVDVVLLDRRMPGMTGDEVLAAIRERGLDCRVAMVTAVDPDFDVVEMAFDDYLTKPVTQEDLRETVGRLAAFAGYDEAFRDYFAVSQTIAALESSKPREALADSEEYARLTARQDELRDALDETIDGLGPESMAALFDDRSDGWLDPDPDPDADADPGRE